MTNAQHVTLQNAKSVPTLAQCIWDVLKDNPEGLSIASIVEELQQRGLNDFSGVSHPHGQVAYNLGRHLDHFTKKGGSKRLWGPRVHEPAAVELDTPATSQDTKEQAAIAEGRMGSSQAAAARLPNNSSKRATRSSSSANSLADAQLVGLACTLWWEGEQDWYPGIIKSWNHANGTYTIQYEDGDQETGAAFTRYSLEPSQAGDMVRVHEFQPGKYTSQAARVEDTDAGPPTAVNQSAQDLYVHDAGAVDTSDEDLPLPTLAGRHPSQPNRAAQPQALDAAVSEAISDAHKTLGTAAALPVVEAPAPSKASSMNQAQAAPSEAAAATQRNTPAEAETSAAEAEAAPAPRGSPEPRSAPPAAIELRTTRSRSKRMSQDASPSLSIASKQSLRNEPDGKAILAKPPSGRRKRSITPAHPPAAVTPSPAAAEAVAGMGPTATVKAASAGVKRQRTPDTPTAASKKPVASRRSSRLKATPLDQSEDLQPKTNSQIDPEAVLTAKHAASANSPPGGGMQLDSAATAEDNQEKNLAPTVTVGQTQALELAKPAAATAATDALHAASARATAAALDATHAVADALPQAVVEPVEGVSHSQPQSAVCDNVRASVEVLRQAEHPAQADAHVLDQHQGTTRPQSAAASTRGTTLDNHAPISPGKPAVGGKDTDTSNTEGVQGTLASDASGRAGVTAVAPALAPIQSAEDSVPLDVAVPSEAAAQCSDLEEAQPSRSDAAAAAASHEDASDAGQAAEIGLGSGFEEAQAPSIDATSLGAAPQAVDTGSASATKSVDSAAEPVALTGPYASPGTSGQDTSAPDAIMSLAVPAAANPPASTASAAGPSAVQPDARSPAVPAATSASAVQTEGVVAVASAPVSPLAASPPHELTVQSADLAATAAAAPPTAPPPPPHAAAFAAAEAPPSITEVPTAAAAVTAAPPTAVGAAAALTAAPPEAHAPSADAAPPTIAPTPTAAADADAAPTTTATHAKLKTVSISKPPQPSGSTRIGLPHRPSSLSKSLLGAAQQKAGSTHMRPILSKGLTPAPKTAKAPHRSPSEGSTGGKRKRETSPSLSLQPTSEAKSRHKGSKHASGRSRESTASPPKAPEPVEVADQVGQPFPSIIANSSASPHHLPPPHATHTHTLPLQQQLHANTALPQDLKPPAEQLPAQVPLQLPSQLPAPGHAPMSQRAAQQQQAQGSISPALQEAEQRASRVWVPLHKGVGLVRLCISAEPNTGSHSNKPQQGAPASPWLVSKYAAWPFTCLWPESPPSQPPPLPSRSPSPPPIPPSNTGHGPTHRQPHTQPATVISQRMAYGMDPQGFQAPSAAEQQASASVAGSIHRPSGKQAPKVLMEPDFGNSALEEPLQPASKRHRGGLSRSPDEGRPGGPHASSRDAVRTSQPVSASKVDRNSTPASRADPTPPRADPALSSRAASSLHRSHEHRAPAKYSTSQHTQPDSSHGHGLGHRSAAHRDAYHAREHSHPRSSSRDIRRERAHGRDNDRYRQSARYREDDRSYHRRHADNRVSDRRQRSRSTSSSSGTSSSSRGRRHSPRHHETHRSRHPQPRPSHQATERGRDDRPRASHYHRDRDIHSRADRDRGQDRDRYDGSIGKQAHATLSHGSRRQRADSRGNSRAAGDPPGVSVTPSSPSRRSQASSVSPEAAPAASFSPPGGFRNGRIFWSSDRTFRECMEKQLFASKDEQDIADMGEDTAVFLWNCFQRQLHGVWVTTKQGNLEPHAFGGRFLCQAQVREQHMFAKPLPIETVLPILPRIPGRPGTSFEQHLDRDQVCKVYNAFVRHNRS